MLLRMKRPSRSEVVTPMVMAAMRMVQDIRTLKASTTSSLIS